MVSSERSSGRLTPPTTWPLGIGESRLIVSWFCILEHCRIQPVLRAKAEAIALPLLRAGSRGELVKPAGHECLRAGARLTTRTANRAAQREPSSRLTKAPLFQGRRVGEHTVPRGNLGGFVDYQSRVNPQLLTSRPFSLARFTRRIRQFLKSFRLWRAAFSLPRPHPSKKYNAQNNTDWN